jgi:hypothetical protein
MINEHLTLRFRRVQLANTILMFLTIWDLQLQWIGVEISFIALDAMQLVP